MSLIMRDYQTAAGNAVRDRWRAGVRRPAVVLPTGAGKTVVFADLIGDVDQRPPGRALVVAHRTELIEQAVRKIRAVAPHLSIGVVKGDRDETGRDVVVGSVQTLRHERRRARVRNVGMVVVDECHHATAASYLAVLRWYGAIPSDEAGNRSSVAVGFTATMSRGDGVGLGQVWEEIAYSATIADMIDRGFLVEPRGVRVDVEDLDLDQVRRTRGDYQDGALGAALADSMAPKRIVEAWLQHAQTPMGGRPTILFSPTVEFASIMVDEFERAGVTARLVHGMMPDDERRAALADFTAGRVSVLCNCMVLTEGTDLPLASCCVVARPTTHQGLYVQMVGRVLRPYPGKVDALVLDVAGASRRHALKARVDLVGLSDLDDRLDDDQADDEVELDDLFDDPGDGRPPKRYRDGSLVSEVIDLFHGSRHSWSTTRAGVWYLSTGIRYIVIVPGVEQDTWDAASVGKKSGSGSTWIVRGVPDVGYAMAYAEQTVTDAEQTLAARERGWRKRPVSQKQRNLAGQLNVVIPEGARSGDASTLIDRVFASGRIDPFVPEYARRRLLTGR